MSRIIIDLRYSVRTFLRAPALAAALLLTIALGIGSNVAVQGFVRGLTGTHTPLKTPPNFVSIFVRGPLQGLGPASYADFQSLKTLLNSFEWIGVARITRVTISLAGRPSVVSVAAITPNLATLLNLPLTQGSTVISHRLSQDELNIKGDLIRIGTETVRLAGIAPEDVTGIYDDIPIDLWLPFSENPLQGRDRTTRNLWLFGVLRPSANAVDSPELVVRPFNGMTPEKADGLARVGTVLRVAGACVFFIACANVAAFLIGRATDRSRETSLRVALGAGRKELAQAVLADSIIISLAGGALGALLSVWTSKILPVLLFEQDAERLTFTSDPSSIAAASGMCIGMMIVCGLLPLIAIPHNRPAAVLRREGTGPSKMIQGMRSGLVIAQMACCCLLVTSTGFLLESLHSAFRTNVTHGLGQPVLATVSANPDVGLKYFQDVEQAAESVPGVSGMAWAGRLPGTLPALQSFRIDPQRLPERDVSLGIAPFTSHSLELFVFPPKAGRMFSFADPSCRVAIVNEEADKILFAGETAGRSIRDPSGRPTEIIGVLAARKGQSAARRPTVYLYHSDESGPPFDRIQMAHFRASIVLELSRSELDANVVSLSYFAAMGFSLVAGRLFSEDPKPHECRVGVVNREAADLYFGGDAMGAAVIDESGRRTEIIGVVNSPPLGTFQRRIEPAIYFPMAQDYLPRMTLIIGAREASDSMLAEAGRKLDSVAGRGPAPIVIKTLDTHLAQTALAPLRIATVIIGASAATALLLSIAGLYGTLDDAARRRSRELAIRIALGAKRTDIIFQVLRQGAMLAGSGILISLGATLLLAKLLRAITPGSESPALWAWIAGPIVLAGAIAMSSILPARRALMVDPINILREDN